MKTDISSRLLRFSLKMMKYDYDIEHIKGKENVIADTLSRLKSEDKIKLPDVHFFVPSINIAVLINEVNRDKFLCGLKGRNITGNWNDITAKENYFKKIALQLTVDKDGLIRYQSLIVPPSSLYHQIFENAHQTHNGIRATLSLIQRELFWPHM